ncbi:MAG: F0F1 ATP synthase subunit delta [bacterium]
MGTMIYLILAQAVVFAVMVIGIRQLLLSDTLKATGKLREAEGELGKKEEAVRKRIEENEAEFRRKNAEAQDALVRTREAMEKELVRSRESMLEEAKKERDRIVDDAVRNREKVKQELAREAETRTMDHAGRIYEMVFSADLGRRLDYAFIEELLAALDGMDASSITVDAPAIEVECAHPLDEAHKKRIQSIIAAKFEVSLGVHETINADLIAGMKIKLGSLEIDGSLRNRFREAVDQLKSEHT